MIGIKLSLIIVVTLVSVILRVRTGAVFSRIGLKQINEFCSAMKSRLARLCGTRITKTGIESAHLEKLCKIELKLAMFHSFGKK